MAMKILDESELKELKSKFSAIHEKYTDGSKWAAKFDELFDEFERGFSLIGATCVEDRL